MSPWIAVFGSAFVAFVLATGCHGPAETRGSRIDLTGAWDAAALSPEDRAPPTQSVTVTIPSNLYALPEFRTSRPPSFRLRRQVQLPPGASGLGLRTGVISDRDRTLFNGALIGETLPPAGGPAAYDRSRIYPIPDSLVREGTNEIEVTVNAYFPHEAGILSGSPTVAPLAQLYQEQLVDEIPKILPVGLLLAAGCYFGLFFGVLYARVLSIGTHSVSLPSAGLTDARRREASHLWLSLFLLALGAYLAHRSSLKYLAGLDLLALKRMEYVALCLLAPPLTEYFRSTFPLPPAVERIARVPRRAVGLVLLLAGLWVCLSSELRSWDSFNVLVIQRILWPILLIEAGARLVTGLRQRQSNAALTTAGSLLALAGGAIDVLSHQGIWQAPHVAHLSFLAFPFSLAIIQINRIVRMQQDLEGWAHTLERRVADRTAALSESLHHVQQLKDRQDGDYYLTSLLLRPLSTQDPPDCPSSISLSLFCRQKKRFLFRGRTVELGGDINVAARIVLGKRPYLAVLNGDAMGKSIQGAGGALVLGTVFRSHLDGTPHARGGLTPEDWLVWCYEGLFNVFRSFDGSMMASAVIALLDEETGTLFHLNAEHPRIVLMRQGRASFLCSRNDQRRFGFASSPERPFVQITPLHAGDVLFLGTDGRDDLRLCGPRTQSGEPSEHMNDDPRLFLRAAAHTERQLRNKPADGKAALARLVRTLEHVGSLTDDLALMRIAWHGTAASAALRTTRVA